MVVAVFGSTMALNSIVSFLTFDVELTKEIGGSHIVGIENNHMGERMVRLPMAGCTLKGREMLYGKL